MSVHSSIDPATLAVVQNGLSQIVNEMDLTTETLAFNPVMSEARDRASGIYHPESAKMVAQGETGMPIFIGVMQFAVESTLADFPDMRPGDIVVLNDPYRGGTHLMDIKLVKPFYYRGERLAILANTGHWTDVGGAVPGGFGVRATEIIQEGLRVPPILLYKEGELDQGVLDLMLSNMRGPEERLGDLKAQLAALNVGEQRLAAFVDKYGKDTVVTCIDELLLRSEQQMRSYLDAVPDGSYAFETCLDSDGRGEDPIAVVLDMKVSGTDITFDFSRSSPPVQGPLNSAISATTAAVYLAVKHVLPEVPINAGCFEPITVVASDEVFLNAKYPKAVSGSSAEVSLRVVDAVLGCMAQALPERVPAACFGTVANFTISGHDPLQDKSYVMFRFSGGGYGGHPETDGLTNGSAPISSARTSPVEVLEQLYPVRFDHYRIREGSAGAGERRGGFGMSFQARLLRGEAVSSVLADRGRFPPYGLHGGHSGAPTEIVYELEGAEYRPPHVTKDEGVEMVPGDAARIATGGGGGWGDPLRRKPGAVVRDIRTELVSEGHAREAYGVMVRRDEAGGVELDEQETLKLRARLNNGLPPSEEPATGDGELEEEEVKS